MMAAVLARGGGTPSERLCYFLYMFIALFLLALSLGPQSLYAPLTVEDGPMENASAVLCLLGAYFAVRAFFLRREALSKNHFALLLAGFLFFFVGMEEMSWGQRMIGIKPLISSAVANYQKEINIHNIPGIDMLVYIGGFLFIVAAGGVLPVATYFSERVRLLCVRWGVPLMPRAVCASLWLGFIFLALIPLFRYCEGDPLNIYTEAMYPLMELRELYFCFALFAYVFVDYFNLAKYGRPLGALRGKAGGDE